MEQEEANFEKARRLVRIAATAARDAALALGNGDPTVRVNQAVVGAARRHLPGVDRHHPGARCRRQGPLAPSRPPRTAAGRWRRQQDKIVLDGRLDRNAVAVEETWS